MDRRHHLGAAHAVDRCVMDLRHHREAAGLGALDIVEALDDVHLPERLREVERAGVQARDLDAELAPVAGLGERDVSDVELEVEVRVLHPVGVVEVDRDVDDLLAEAARQVQAPLDVGEDALEGDRAAGSARLVVYREGADVHRRVGLLEVEE
jgi:hypothetical protein